ncbi:g11621 [Coccomyxa viridis]|uniref:mannan endo-1,4-beta-mannosidase n=1 Tax=Coccomyxa viridis TaxID=1274662 RepID=A0ABP1G8D2_9CHLO
MAILRAHQAARQLVAIAALVAAVLVQEAHAFIKIRSGSFVDENCQEFFFSGYNTWQLLETAAGKASGDVGKQFDAAVANNLTTVRMFGFGTMGGFALQSSIGSYNEQAFQAFDKVLDLAAKRQLRLVIALANNWDQDSNADNKKFYVGGGSNADDFYTLASARQAYKNHLKVVTSRKNTVNGKIYCEDPVIVAWNLINEPRCDALGCNKNIQAWVGEMAPYLKSLDPNHLITIGMDGFYDRRSCQAAAGNPSSWAGYTGQDFLPQHAVAAIDFAAIHLWPDNWKRTEESFGKIWLTTHSANGAQLQKPVVLEEFGKGVGGELAKGETAAQRLGWYKEVYNLVEQQLQSKSPLKGILFWRWDGVTAAVQDSAVGDNALNVATSSDVFQQVIKPFSSRIAQYGQTVAGCTPTTPGTVSAASIGAASDSTGPGPENFQAPDSATCCSNDCNTLYGLLNATVTQSAPEASAGACCNACKSTTGCTAWNYCYCELGCAGGIAKGTCQLKNLANAFYPEAKTTGEGAGWIGGVPGRNDVVQTWLCQPGGNTPCPSITDATTCPADQLKASLQCPDPSCNAKAQNVDGEVVVFDVNSLQPQKVVYNAADCCAQCKKTSGCNTWTFCNSPDGCSSDCPSNVATAKATGGKTFGPYGGCQGDHFPYQQCSLKASTAKKVYEAGELQPYTSGFL